MTFATRAIGPKCDLQIPLWTSHRSRDFAIVNGHLYKKGISKPMLKCITEAEGIELLHEVHRGICGSHSGPRALAAKAIHQGF